MTDTKIQGNTAEITCFFPPSFWGESKLKFSVKLINGHDYEVRPELELNSLSPDSTTFFRMNKPAVFDFTEDVIDFISDIVKEVSDEHLRTSKTMNDAFNGMVKQFYRIIPANGRPR